MRYLAASSLLLFGGVYATAYLGLGSRWWFEDDPALFAYASQIRNPVSIFADPEVLRHLTTGRALAPMQLLSYWIDVRLAGFSRRFAYTHQTVSFLLTLVFLYLFLVRAFQGDRAAALLVSCLWALLPSTAVVLQFAPSRHYLEGLLFTVLTLYLLQRLRDDAGQIWPAAWRRAAWTAALLSIVAGMLCKETYAVLIPAIVLLYAWQRREHDLALSTAAIVCAYTVYRYWMLGPALSYGMPLLSIGQYLKFLSKLPYSLSSNYGGYCLCGIIAALCYYFARQNRDNLRTVVFFLAALALSLGPIFPVSFSLYGTIRSPDPWYRILFLLNTVVIVFGGYLAVRSVSRRMQLALAILAIAIVIPGAEKTRRLWIEMTASAEREGKFYVSNPDKILLSEQAAWWFIPGVDQMYQVKTPHYVLLKDLPDLQPGTTIWRFRNGEFVPEVWGH
jgi:hypothetical protein